MNPNYWSAMKFPISHFLISGVFSMLQTGKSLHINLDFYNHDTLEDHRLVLYIYYGVFWAGRSKGFYVPDVEASS